MVGFIRDFLKIEAAGGIVLMASALAALLAANSPFASHYNALVHAPIVHLWVNDGLMSVFFLLVGLEIKREMVEGELSTREKALLPFGAALGGIIVPALIYMCVNDSATSRGWAIPTATDIAFAVGVLALFGSRIPPSLKIFLMALAIIDDLVAVLIIAVFYTDHLAMDALVGAMGAALLLFMLNRKNVRHPVPYFTVGALLWYLVWKSGVHPTVAGVVLGALIPVKGEGSLGNAVIHRLHPWVAFGIMPLFAFANAGIPLSGLSMSMMSHPISLGIGLGLFAGKQLGIFGASWLLVRLRLAQFPPVSKTEFYAVCILGGIGFTMSLFIGNLAFADYELQFYVRLGVMLGSVFSALAAYLLLVCATRKAVS